MSSKKNIDELFKERFDNHEVAPPAQVWENIQAAMREEKKDRMVIPLWWKVGGIAALLAVMFTIGASIFNTPTNGGLVEDGLDAENLNEEISPYINTEKEFNTTNNAIKVVEESTKAVEESNASINTNNTNGHSIGTNEQVKNIQLATENIKSITSNQKEANKLNRVDIKSTSSTLIAETTTPFTLNKEIKTSTSNKERIEGVTGNETSRTTGIADATNNVKPLKNTLSDTETQKRDPKVTEAVAIETIAKEKADQELDNKKQSIFDAIKEQNKVETNDAVVVKDSPIDRWEVAPNFAPVYYNTLSEGSSIDNSFADNSQSGDVNISYGVAVSYAVSNRLSIRSGINNVSLGYSTGGLELGEGDINAALKNINYNDSGQVTIPQDQGTFASQNGEEGFGNITPKSTSGEAFINQNITYYEVPLELKYSLFDTKLGVNVIGGLSTLFLGNNEISVNAGDFSETLGEANNLSNLSFSTNVGLGFDYKFSEKFKFNIEPMFKYQLNPYTDSSVNFQPYYVGIYTGLSYKF